MRLRPAFRMFAAAVLAVAAGGAGPIDPAAVETLVGRLGAATRAERVAAEAALLGLGPDALPALDAAAGTSLSPAQAEAVRRIVARLEHQRAEASVQASRVTLERSGPLGDVLAEIARQTGNRFAPTPEQAARPVRIAAKDEPFWPAVEVLLAVAGLEPGTANAAGALELRPRETAGAVGHSGAFRLVAGPAKFRAIAGGDGRLVRVPLTVTAEPRLRPLFLTYAGADLTLTAAGTPLPPFSPDTKLELPLGGRDANAELRLDFVAPEAEQGRTLGELRLAGTLAVTTAADAETFSFPLVGATRMAQRQGGVTVRLRGARVKDGAAEAAIDVVYDRGGPAFESHRTWVFHNAAAVVGPRGERIEHAPGFSTLAQTDGGVAVRYRFESLPADAAGWTFVYTAPTLIVDVPVTVEIGGVTMRPRTP